jgi:hypothetical protein
MYRIYFEGTYIQICIVHVMCISTRQNAYLCIWMYRMYLYVSKMYYIQYTYRYIRYIQVRTDIHIWNDTCNTYRYRRIHANMQIQTIHTIHADTRLGRVRFQNTYTYRYILIHANAYKYTDTYIYKRIHTDIDQGWVRFHVKNTYRHLLILTVHTETYWYMQR